MKWAERMTLRVFRALQRDAQQPIPRSTRWIRRTLERDTLNDIQLTDEDRRTLEEERPKTRADCVDGPRPCPWVGCRHNLGIDVSPRIGSVAEHTTAEGRCALDVAEEGPKTLEEVGAIMGITRERVRQIESEAIAKLRRRGYLLRDLV